MHKVMWKKTKLQHLPDKSKYWHQYDLGQSLRVSEHQFSYLKNSKNNTCSSGLFVRIKVGNYEKGISQDWHIIKSNYYNSSR